MKQAFVSIVSSYVGFGIASILRHHGYDVVGSIRSEDEEDVASLVSQTVHASDEEGTARLALFSDVVVLCLIEDVQGADAVLSAFLQQSGNEFGGPTHLLVLSTTMTWAKTKQLNTGTGTAIGSLEMQNTWPPRSLSRPVSVMAMDIHSTQASGGAGGGINGGGLTRASSAIPRASPSRDSCRPPGTAVSKNGGRASHGSALPRRRFQGNTREPAMTEADYLLRQPATGYLEHKRLETTALLLQSSSLSVCIVGAGVPYGLGEGPFMLRVFRDAWRARNKPAAMPTCTSGDNHLALINVVDLSVAVGNLLRPIEPDALPPPFPKPYILAVEGDGVQCTAKELAAAIGRAFGGSGETRAMAEAELEEVLIEEPAAQSLLMSIRFSNDGSVLAGMVAGGLMTPITWSKGFAASAKSVAQEFVSSRSLQPIKTVVLGPPGGDQGHVCRQISERYGMLYIDVKTAVDGVFQSLGKPFPLPIPPEEKVQPPPKGKKAKDTKKAAKAEPSPEALAELEALPPAERLLVDIQGAFDPSDVPLSDYTTLDARGLARVLSPSIIARSARLMLEEKKTQWACSGYILCDIPFNAEVISEVFGDDPPQSPQQPAADAGGVGGPSATTTTTAAAAATTPGGAAAPGSESDMAAGDFLPTHLVYLHESLEYIVSRQKLREGSAEGGVAGGRDTEAKLRADLERYFSEGQRQNQPNGKGEGEEAGRDENRDSPRERERWIPTMVQALKDRYAIKAEVIDGGGGQEGGIPMTIGAVDDYICGGEVPGFVRMLSALDVDVAVGSTEGKKQREESGEADSNGEEADDGSGGGLDAPSTEVEMNANDSHITTNNTNMEEDHLSLMEVLAKLTARDAKEVEERTRKHRNFLTDGVLPQVAAGLVAAAEAQPENIFEFLAEYLISAGKALQSKVEEEAAHRYQTGLALLKEMEEKDNQRAAAVYR